MRIRKDCLHYHEEPYMGARVDCCLAETAFGMCPCTPDCENYIPRDSSARIVRCKDCKHVRKWRSEESAKKFGQVYECALGVLACPDPNDFCSYGVRKSES